MNFYTAKQIAEKWHISPQQVRRYCKEGTIKGAFLYEGQWLIPEKTKAPDKLYEEEIPQGALLKKVLYQLERNNHYGIYEYIQVNLAYSSSRMASNRLTREQVQEMYRTNRITPAFEATKVDDIFEVANHFHCTRYALENAGMPLTVEFIQHLHYLLVHGTYSDKRNKTAIGVFRTRPAKWGVPPEKNNRELKALIEQYEGRASSSARKREVKTSSLERILDFHVKLEQIRPFEDYNGRVGRIIMMKECLRHEIDPFIIDDKRRGEYNRGISLWDTDMEIMKKAVSDAQRRFQKYLEVCQLMQFQRPVTGRGAR